MTNHINKNEFLELIIKDEKHKKLYELIRDSSNTYGCAKLVYAQPQIKIQDGSLEKYNWTESKQTKSKEGIQKVTKNYEFQPQASYVIGGSVTKQQQSNPFQIFTDFLDQSHHIFKSKKDFLEFAKGNFSNIQDAEILKQLGKVFYLFASEHFDQIISEKKEASDRERLLESTNPENRSQQLLDLYPSNAIWKQKDAAALVGMSTRTLYKRMQAGLFKIHKSSVYIKSFLEYLHIHEPNYFNNALEKDL